MKILGRFTIAILTGITFSSFAKIRGGGISVPLQKLFPMKKLVMLIFSVVIVSEIMSQNVGIGTTNPISRLHVTDSNVIFTANSVVTSPAIFNSPINGAGTRLMWLPQKSAFRAGTVEGDEWDASKIGTWSTAFGRNNQVSGDHSFAAGYGNTVTGALAAAFGQINKASGAYSFVNGFRNEASGYVSTAIGFDNFAKGYFSFSIGNGTNARAYNSFALGRFNDTSFSSSPEWVHEQPLMYIGNGSSNTDRHNAMVVYKNGNMILKNPTPVTANPASYLLPVVGAGTRMMWLPEKAAFRTGSVFGTNWDEDSIGLASFAAGTNNIAKGESSTAFGNSNRATGIYSFAAGSMSEATGGSSIALGVLTMASGANSFAAGRGSLASGTYSTAFGSSNISAGLLSTSMGINNEANGYASWASGLNNFSNGDLTFTMGSNNRATAFSSLALGQYSAYFPSASLTSWVSTDPVVVIGNGTSNATRSNALVIYKNGNTDISGYTQLGSTAEEAPSIKMKKLLGVSSSVDGGDLAIPHGLTRSKIIGVQVLLQYTSVGGGGDVLPGYTESNGFEYSVSVTSTSINIFLVPGNCASILNKPVRVLVTYEE